MEIQTNTIKSKLSPGFFFLSIGLLISLITSVVAFLNLVFSTLDKKFPDILNASYSYGYSSFNFESIRISLSTLIIFFPIYLIVFYFWKKIVNKEIGQIDEIIKKWVIYIILFLSILVVTIDLVTLVRYFVSGEITNRFIYKVIVTFFSAILIVKYHFVIFISQFNIKFKKIISFISFIFAISFFVLAIIYSFSVMGSPKKQRALRIDDRRVSDLQNIQYQIINFWQQKERLPESFKDLSNPIVGYPIPVDPEFEKGLNYEYKTIDKLSFELCATFSTDMPKGWREYNSSGVSPMNAINEIKSDNIASPAVYPTGINDSWDHKTGRTCFIRKIDKDIYPPFKK